MTATALIEPPTATQPAGAQPAKGSALARAWAAIRSAVGVLLGLVPHVMHHIGIIAGAAFLTGVFGNSLLFVVGLALSVPMLHRLQRHYRTWKAPAIGVVVFTALFALSAFVIGPAISSPKNTTPAPTTQTMTQDQHSQHHH